MDNRLIFLYFVRIVQDWQLIVLSASGSFGSYVYGTGFCQARCGVTEWENQSVYIDWTLNV